MIRPLLAIILLFGAIFMMRGVASDWRKDTFDAPVSSAKKSAQGADAALPAVPTSPFQPSAPATLPDLKVGYVFNQERMLGGDEPLPEEDMVEEEGPYNANAQGITADIEDITFVGSIIADNFSRALVLYPTQSLSGPAKPTSRSSRSKGPPPGSAAGPEEHAQLEVGDQISGYEVTEILPDKLIFSKGDETIEKLLFDPEKARQSPPSRLGGGPPGGGPPRPPSPGGVLSTTIGGGGAPAAPMVGSGGSAPPPPTMPSVPAMQQGAHPPSAPQISAPSGAVPSAPVRRMVISRQPSPAPDTSKVNRQIRGVDEVVPLPPGMGADGANDGLPSSPGIK